MARNLLTGPSAGPADLIRRPQRRRRDIAPAARKNAAPPFALPGVREVVQKRVCTFADLMSVLDALKFSIRGLWYRGTPKASYELLPTLFRHKSADNLAALKKLELDLNESFYNQCGPFGERSLVSCTEWERLFFMQHYRFPTRLLDWSGSPLVALHFAVTSVQSDGVGTVANDVAIWVLDPVAWNNAVYGDTGFNGGVLSSRDPWLRRYSPAEVYTQVGGLPPVALRGVNNSARIVAQQGHFTVFGPRPEPMETAFSMWKDDGTFIFPENCLTKIVIAREHVTNIRAQLFSLGISEATISPDLEGLSDELKRRFEF